MQKKSWIRYKTVCMSRMFFQPALLINNQTYQVRESPYLLQHSMVSRSGTTRYEKHSRFYKPVSVESVQIWAVKPIDLLMILSPYLHGTSCIHHNAHQLEKTWLSYLLTCHTSVISIRASSSTICMIFEIYTLELLSKTQVHSSR